MTSVLRILGVMTGTSCDGLDAACIEVSEKGWQPLWSAAAPYPAALRARVLEAQLPGVKRAIRDLLGLERDLGAWYGSTLSRIIARKPVKPDAIANHGQTVAHFPAPGRQGMTLQMGDPTRIAAATGLTVVAKFRDGDMAAGGQGAPLAPLFHRVLAGKLGGGIAINNIGGISNLTYVPMGRGDVIAFDTGPGNIWIDSATEQATRGRQKYDRGGKLALSGTPDGAAVERVLRLPYFSARAPKSTGRDDFPYARLKTRARGADLVATASAVTVESIARAYEDFILKKGLPLRQVLVCGGGAKNLYIMEGLAARLPGTRVRTLTEAGFDSQLIEAQAFAYFGYLSLRGRPVGGSWTGARGFGPPGWIIPGANWSKLVTKL